MTDSAAHHPQAASDAERLEAIRVERDALGEWQEGYYDPPEPGGDHLTECRFCRAWVPTFKREELRHAWWCPAAGQVGEDLDWLISRAEVAIHLRSLLERLEWAGGSGCEYAACPDCDSLPSHGHAPDCELAAALREAP